MLKVKEIRCCGLHDPVGLKERNVTFSWKLISDRNNVFQKECRLLVNDSLTGQVMWDSGVHVGRTQSIIYSGEPLKSNRKYCYEVHVTDNYGERARSSRGYFSIGIAKEEWKAHWIGASQNVTDKRTEPLTKEQMVDTFRAMTEGRETDFRPDRRLEPCNVFRKIFFLDDVPEEGWLSVTAHGLYDARINGNPVTDTRLNPGFTAYDKYLEFQTYDAAKLLKKGKNVITFILADGWYRGTFGMLGFGDNYGTELSLLAQLELTGADSKKEWILTDDSFEYRESACRYSDIFIGEKWDGRIDMESIYAGTDVSEDWKQAEVKDYGYEHLCGICCEPVRCTQVIPAEKIFYTPKGELVADLGQNIAGTVRLKAEGTAGTVIKLEHSEVLDKDGNFINNISGPNRDQTDYFILSGRGEETFEPVFTFHGFRYVKITGYPGTLTVDKIQGIVTGSDLEKTGSFRCSDTRLNRLQENIQWSQRGNMISVPMDCPQRERAGWTGDILVYGKTAVYNQNVKNFLEKWLENMELEQFENGLIPIVIPYSFGYSALQYSVFGNETSAGWGDAAIMVPWFLYQSYGDIRILKKSFPMMKKWMDYVERDASEHMPEGAEDMSPEQRERQKYLWNTGFHFGDWCYPSCQNEKGETDMFQSAFRTKEYVSTVMYANSTRIMSEICKILDKNELAVYYRLLNEKIRDAFSREYILEDGSINGATQGIYVLAIAAQMGGRETSKKMAEHLVRMIEENGDCLDTGFMSIPYLMDVLVDCGCEKTAEKLLYQEKCPSWLYEVKNGATTMWETWNAILEDGTRTTYSYNHYAFGCVGDWMYRTLLGIRNAKAGYRKIRIQPDFRFGLTEAEGSHESIYGRIFCKWKLFGQKGQVMVSIPVGTEAEIVLPGKKETVGSGDYEFTFCMQHADRNCSSE